MSLKLKLGMKIALAAILTAGAGTSAYAYYTVNASDSIDVPDFSGKAQRIVENWAKKNNLEDQVKFEQEYSDDVLSDCVISQSARKVSARSTITFTLSQGPDPEKEVELPDFAGKKKDDIEAWFADNYFSNVTYTYTNVTDKDLEDDMFVSMDPAAGTKAKRSDAITVTLATTEVVAPDFSSMSKDELQKWGDENGIAITFAEQESQILNDGDIVSISVKAGDKLKKGDTVTVTIAKHADSTDAEKSQEEVSRQTTDTNANGGTRDSGYSDSSSTTGGNSAADTSGNAGTTGNNGSNSDASDHNSDIGSSAASAPASIPLEVFDGQTESEIKSNLASSFPGVTFHYSYADNPNDASGIASYSTNPDGSANVSLFVAHN